MKIALSNIAWERSEEEEVIGLMRRSGVSGVEIAPTKVWENPTQIEQAAAALVKKGWNDNGIQVTSLQALLFGHPEFTLFGTGSDRDELISYLGGICRLGGWLGAGPLVFGSPKNRLKGELSFESAAEIAVPFFRRAADLAEANQTILCLEPNPREYGCDFMTNTSEALEIVQRVDHAALRLHLDSGIMTMNGEDPIEWLPQSAPFLAHFHCSEPNLAVIGSGGVDHDRFASALRGIGYGGWVSIEMRGGWNEPNTISVEQALAVATRAYGGA